MQANLRKLVLLLVILLSIGLTALFAQGMGGGPGGPGGPGGHGGPGGPGGWPPDSSQCDSTGQDSLGHWGHHGPGHHWGHGDSTGHDSTGFAGHPGWHHGGHGGFPGHDWGHGDSLTLDSIFVSGVISTLSDTVMFGGGAGFPGAPDSGEFVRTKYFLDVDADAIADYELKHLRRLGHMDSTFVLPVDGDQVSVSGLLFTSEDQIARILVLTLTSGADPDVIGSLMAVNPGQVTDRYRLDARNYPNPFNPSTVIEFNLTESGRTTLKVYDIRGAEVAVLADANLTAGVHNITFNPQTLSAGTYLYVLEANGQREIRRMAYLK